MYRSIIPIVLGAIVGVIVYFWLSGTSPTNTPPVEIRYIQTIDTLYKQIRLVDTLVIRETLNTYTDTSRVTATKAQLDSLRFYAVNYPKLEQKYLRVRQLADELATYCDSLSLEVVSCHEELQKTQEKVRSLNNWFRLTIATGIGFAIGLVVASR